MEHLAFFSIKRTCFPCDPLICPTELDGTSNYKTIEVQFSNTFSMYVYTYMSNWPRAYIIALHASCESAL